MNDKERLQELECLITNLQDRILVLEHNYDVIRSTTRSLNKVLAQRRLSEVLN